MTKAAEDVTRTEAWLVAARPHTLPASVAPVLVGTGLAVHEGVFAPDPALAALVGAMLLQVGANLANDYYDAVKGVDSEDSPGYTRVTQAGLLPPEHVKAAMAACFGLALLVGHYVVAVGGLPIMVVGLAGIVSGVAYGGGPYPLGSNGLGDLFVFVFFGVVAVVGTFYVQAASQAVAAVPVTVPPGTVTAEAVVASLAPAGIVTNVLVVNNVRDLEADRRAGKHTLAVYLGYRGSRAEYVANLALAYLLPIVLWQRFGFDLLVLLPLVTLPYAAVVTRTVLTRTDEDALNPALERTGKLLAAHSTLFALGTVLAA
ncbi:1,4-dihydroxy-2-naphthoate polyprenyltransferase [Halobacteriales archaeon QS_1_68_20]|nr:MAG: 1,4-dihydroxy-2-naphthoate polyprenyltransferase [Halobacteriales archaeon QS_1_68_20]